MTNDLTEQFVAAITEAAERRKPEQPISEAFADAVNAYLSTPSESDKDA